MSLWWLQPGWTGAACPHCGAKIWPEGDPDWGACYSCFTQGLEHQRAADEEARHFEEMEERRYREMEQESANSTWEMCADTTRALRGNHVDASYSTAGGS